MILVLALVIALSAWLLGMFLPWWSITIPALLFGALLGKKGLSAFAGGFAGIGILWLLQSLFIHVANDGLLTDRIAGVLDLPHVSLLFLITLLIGGLTGGFSSLTGYHAKRAFRECLSTRDNI